MQATDFAQFLPCQVCSPCARVVYSDTFCKWSAISFTTVTGRLISSECAVCSCERDVESGEQHGRAAFGPSKKPAPSAPVQHEQ